MKAFMKKLSICPRKKEKEKKSGPNIDLSVIKGCAFTLTCDNQRSSPFLKKKYAI